MTLTNEKISTISIGNYHCSSSCTSNIITKFNKLQKKISKNGIYKTISQINKCQPSCLNKKTAKKVRGNTNIINEQKYLKAWMQADSVFKNFIFLYTKTRQKYSRLIDKLNKNMLVVCHKNKVQNKQRQKLASPSHFQNVENLPSQQQVKNLKEFQSILFFISNFTNIHEWLYHFKRRKKNQYLLFYNKT